MTTLLIALKDIVLDETNPIDLTAMPAEQAAARLMWLYAFLAPEAEITVANGIATIHLPERTPAQLARARQARDEAARLARKGYYVEAIARYEDVLELLPADTAARRDLAMAQLVIGDAQRAKANLIHVLQLDPDDAWAYLILGNLYLQRENDLGSAERYYVAARDRQPDDPLLLNAYAVLQAKRSRPAQAAVLFEQVIGLDPSLPFPRVGFAMAQAEQGNLDAALATLDAVFKLPAPTDPRPAVSILEARKTALDLHDRRVAAHAEETAARVAAEIDAFANAAATPIHIEANPTLDTAAKLEPAWRYQRPHHTIVVKGPAGRTYNLAHEAEHLHMLRRQINLRMLSDARVRIAH